MCAGALLAQSGRHFASCNKENGMGQEELLDKIAELEREIALLPEGSIAKKKIRDKEYYYHRITINGKRTDNYVDLAYR